VRTVVGGTDGRGGTNTSASMAWISAPVSVVIHQGRRQREGRPVRHGRRMAAMDRMERSPRCAEESAAETLNPGLTIGMRASCARAESGRVRVSTPASSGRDAKGDANAKGSPSAARRGAETGSSQYPQRTLRLLRDRDEELAGCAGRILQTTRHILGNGSGSVASFSQSSRQPFDRNRGEAQAEIDEAGNKDSRVPNARRERGR